mmetsp:Transcript_13374/g.25534  ORF Transcript_13374/g.25534 Transcript_13374/m.25534 type:complete len:264 (-) Transcript_13374:1377-2168(-)
MLPCNFFSFSASRSMANVPDKPFTLLSLCVTLAPFKLLWLSGFNMSKRLKPTSPSNPFLFDRSISSSLFGARRLLVDRACFSCRMSLSLGCLPAMKSSRSLIVLSTVLSRSRLPFPFVFASSSSTWSCWFLDFSLSCLFFSSISSFFVSCKFVWFTRMAGFLVMGSLAAHISNSTHRYLLGSWRLGIRICTRKDSNFSTNRTCSMCLHSSTVLSAASCSSLPSSLALAAEGGPLWSGYATESQSPTERMCCRLRLSLSLKYFS